MGGGGGGQIAQVTVMTQNSVFDSNDYEENQQPWQAATVLCFR